MKVLIVAAHPDDEALGCGGTIAKHVQGGDEVRIVILGTGIASRGTPDADAQIAKLRKGAEKSASVLGANKIEFLDFPDNKFDSVPLLDIIRAVEKKVEEFIPDVVYTHHRGDLNVDHRRTFEAVLTACRPASSKVRKLLAFEVMSSTEWRAQTPENAFRPNLFVDISGSIEKKMKALEAYAGEMREYPHPRSPEGVTALAMYRGVQCYRKYAEAFEIIREVN